MGAGEKLKDIYYSGEEKWYSFLDKLDEHMPVYGIIDRIDSVVPSFALFIVLVIIILLLLGLFLLGFVGPGQVATLRLSVSDESGSPIEGAQIKLSGPIELETTSNAYGLVQEVDVPLNSIVKVVASKNDITQVREILVSELNQIEAITLPVKSISFDAKTIRLLTPTGSLATEEVTLTFSCTTPGVNPPDEATTSTGILNVNVPNECGVLMATIKSGKYKAGPYSITASNIIRLEDLVTQSADVTVSLTYEEKLISESVPVEVYRANNLVSPEDTKRAYNGQAIFTLDEGNYYFVTKTTSTYKSARSGQVTVTGNKPQSISIELDKNIVGTIYVKTTVNGTVTEGVHVSLKKGLMEVDNGESDYNGSITFDVEKEGPYTVMASLDGYCTNAKSDVAVGTSITINLTTDNGNCGSTLTARVVDSDGRSVPYAKVALFGENDAGVYKLGYAEKVTDINGTAQWSSIPDSTDKRRVFAYKSVYNGWSDSRTFNSGNADIPFVAELEIPYGTVNVAVKDRDGNPLQYALVTLYDDYSQGNVIGTRIVEDAGGKVSLQVKADKKVYAVVSKEPEEANDLGYETVTTVPKQVIGNGVTNFNVVLPRPPLEKIKIEFLGLYKGDERALKVEAAGEYDALFAVTAPLSYDNLGLFVRVGAENVTKTELDKLYIKDIEAPRVHTITKGSSYNPPRGGEIDSQNLNLEESKWAQVVWAKNSYVPGKIFVKAAIKIRDTAQMGDQLVIAYRAFGVLNGLYDRNPVDDALGTAESSSAKSPLYAQANEEYLKVGEETLCEVTDAERTFCITSSYIDAKENFIHYFDTSFDAKNNETYYLGVKVLNGSSRPQDTYERAKTKFENTEENVFMGAYTLFTPTSITSTGNINGYEGNWIDTADFEQGTSINLQSLALTPQKSGTGTILMRIRDGNELVFEKPFILNIAATDKLKIEFMVNGEFQSAMPTILPGKDENVTVKVFNAETNLEVSGASVKLFDRFGTKLYERTTNTIGIATIVIPAALPGEKLTIRVEKGGYETLEFPFTISEDVVEVTPEELSYTLNPQTKPEETKTVKIENKTGIDLTVREIKLVGKFKGLLDEARIASALEIYKGKIIKAQDYEEIDLRVTLAAIIPSTGDLDGTFQITLGREEKSWVKDVKAKIRVGIGADVDDPSCLSITQANWVGSTEGKEIEFSLKIKNDCLASGKLVPLRDLGAKLEMTGNSLGEFSIQSGTTAAILSKAYARIFRPDVAPGEEIPVTVKFAPYGGINGTTSGKIIFQAINQTDSKPQTITAELNYTIDVVNLRECIVIGADLIQVPAGGSQSFSITNNCPDKVDISLETELQLSSDKFSIPAGSSQDVSVYREAGDIPGAYNILVYGRQAKMPIRLLGNVKAILEAEGCFQLSRYEYDLFVSPFNKEKGILDGIDRGYLKNVCTQKAVTVEVIGIEPINWRRVLLDSLIGGISGYTKGGIWDGNGWHNKKEPDMSKNVNDATKNLNYAEGIANMSYAQPLEENFDKIKTEKDRVIKELEEEKVVNCYAAADEFVKDKCSKNATATEIETMTGIGYNFCDQHYAEKEAKIGEIYLGMEKTKKKIVQEMQTESEKYLGQIKGLRTRLQADAKAGKVTHESLEKDVDAEAKNATDGLEKIANQKYDSYNKSMKTGVASINKEANKKITAKKISINGLTPCGNATFTHAPKIDSIGFEKAVAKPVKVTPALLNQNFAAMETFSQARAPGGDLREAPEGLIGEPSSEEPVEPIITENTLPGRGKTTEWRPYYNTKYRISNSYNIYTVWCEDNKINASATTITGVNKIIANISSLCKKTIYTKNAASDNINNKKQALFLLAGTTTSGITTSGLVSSAATVSNPYNGFGGVGNPGFATNYYGSGTNYDTGSLSVCGGVGGNRNPTAMEKLGSVLMDWGLGQAGGNAVWGALLSGLVSWLQQSDNKICYSKTFAAPLVEIDSVKLTAPDGKSGLKGISMNVGEKTYDYDSVVQPNTPASGTQGATMGGAGYFYNPQTLNASIGLAEIRELTFTNAGKVYQENEFKKIGGLLEVKGTEKIYETWYDYEDTMEMLEDKGEDNRWTNDQRNELDKWFGEVYDADISELELEDLEIKETREYVKKFHLLFSSWETVECGPNTYACPKPVVSNCKVGLKDGSTGEGAIPKIKLEWGWDKISATECDGTSVDDTDKSGYVYCDTTQFTIATMKKLKEIKDFINSNSLDKCPKAIDVAGTKIQELSKTGLDVGITLIQMKEDADKVTVETKVSSNNAQEMDAKVKVTVGGDTNGVAECEETKTFTSEVYYSCEVPKTAIGTGTYQVRAVMIPTLCSTGCENNDTSNDTITSQLILGSTGLGECQSYDTKKDNFSRILAANGLLDSGGSKILGYLNFTASLVRDGFSDDFRKDFDEAKFLNAPTWFVDDGLEALFLSNKFKVSPQNWQAGKYTATIVVTFNDNKFEWSNDNNSIKSVEIHLEPWSEPKPRSSLYDFAFDGTVGLNSDNGRQGYGSSYEQVSEKAFMISEEGGSAIYAATNPNSNAISNVSVSVDDSANTFYNLNVTNRGNVLTIQGSGDNVSMALTPSVAVPLLLSITRNAGADAYGFYNVQVDGQLQGGGPFLMYWTGIGGTGCVDFTGMPMSEWDGSDSPADQTPVGDRLNMDKGYGFGWANASERGTASFYGVMYVPQGRTAIINVQGGDSAVMETIGQSGNTISVSANAGIKSLKDVLELVKQERVCVVGSGDYFWNNKPYIDQLNIDAKANSCIPAS